MGSDMVKTEHAGEVGEWVAQRRAELGWTQQQLAEAVEASLRTVGGVERGESAVAPRSRPGWERALGWPAGSLTAAYRRGVRPGVVVDLGPTLLLLREAGVPVRYASHPDVLDILRAEMSDRDRVALLRVWLAQRDTFERMFDSAQSSDQSRPTGTH
jgi:transcriptional regulator with XRE-family HTH domain